MATERTAVSGIMVIVLESLLLKVEYLMLIIKKLSALLVQLVLMCKTFLHTFNLSTPTTFEWHGSSSPAVLELLKGKILDLSLPHNTSMMCGVMTQASSINLHFGGFDAKREWQLNELIIHNPLVI